MEHNERIAALVWLQNAGQAQYVDFAAQVGQFMIDDLHDDGMIEDISAENAPTAIYKVSQGGRYLVAAHKEIDALEAENAALKRQLEQAQQQSNDLAAKLMDADDTEDALKAERDELLDFYRFMVDCDAQNDLKDELLRDNDYDNYGELYAMLERLGEMFPHNPDTK